MIGLAIKHFIPESEFTCGETYDSLNWLSTNISKPTKAECDIYMSKYWESIETEKTRKEIIYKIEVLEKKTYRPLREISLGIETEYNVSRLEKIDAQIQELRTKL